MRQKLALKARTIKTRDSKLSLMKVKKAISRFISKTEKIVQSVQPNAQIVSNAQKKKIKYPKKKRPQMYGIDELMVSKQNVDTSNWTSQVNISVPQVREIKLSEIPDDQSVEMTDDEIYEAAHLIREKIEVLVRSRFEIRKVKSGSRSTAGIHFNGKTQENFQQALERLEDMLPMEVAQEYVLEGIDCLPWPSQEEGPLEIKLD